MVVDYCIVLAGGADKLLAYIRGAFTSAGIRVVQESNLDGGSKIALSLTATARAFEVEADHLELLKPRSGVDEISGTRGREEVFTIETASDFDGYGKEGFWHLCERSQMVRSLLDHLPVPSDAEAKAILPGGGTKAGAGTETSLLRWLERQGILQAALPLHDADLAKKVFWTVASPKSLLSIDMSPLQEYYGSEVAFYFAWMMHFTNWLLVPGVVGLALMCIWAILFVQFWDRSAAWYSCEWGIPHDLAHHDEIRLDFWGETRTSPVTGKPEVHFSATRRWVRYGVSTLVTCLMLGVAFTVMILSLNLQGYVHEKSPVRVDALSRFAEPGEIFDPNATFTSLIPVILHTIVIMFLNGQYRSVAETLTEWENHKTVHDHENALIIKRFLFEAFDCYIALFYIAFYELDPIKLRQELVSLYTADSLRRLFTETMLPYAMQTASAWQAHRQQKTAQAKGAKANAQQNEAVEAELRRDEYEQFDDYLEMVIQFGYVTLFASAFPLSAALSIACNVLEIRSDMAKLTFMTVWFPSFFSGPDGDTTTALGSGRYVVGLVFGIEHFLLFAALIITWVVPKQPRWVRIDAARREYEKNQALRLARAAQHAEHAQGNHKKKNS
eukprot:g2603.t1